MSESRAFANQEREAQAKRLSRLWRTAMLSLATLLSFTAIGLVMADQLYRPDAFVIDQLKIKGKFRYLQPETIEAVVGDQGRANFFSLELMSLKHDIEALPWVQTADVRREWPNTLLINVREHIPVMRWQSNKWVTTTGKVIDLTGDIKVPNAIVLSGNESDALLLLQQAFRWKKKLLQDGLELRKLTLSGSHAWTLKLYDELHATEFNLLLGREEVEERLARFQFLYQQKFKYADQQLIRVDARYPDGLAIQAQDDERSSVKADVSQQLSIKNNPVVAMNNATDLTILSRHDRL